eukprot:TRINITY_DN5562_c0_g1_i1.p1 TRINITY_DN5562_c0_g1~~TRINITY_DN5562_c0_g1_i1.p1  ORF type:complete len:1094 (+),score=373.20 TRINITY_DN5562_c0_g1_i1:561-3842(+)
MNENESKRIGIKNEYFAKDWDEYKKYFSIKYQNEENIVYEDENTDKKDNDDKSLKLVWTNLLEDTNQSNMLKRNSTEDLKNLISLKMNQKSGEGSIKKQINKYKPLKAVSLKKFIGIITNIKYVKEFPKILSSFIHSFHSFTTPMEFFSYLISRFNGPQNFQNESETKKWEERKSKIEIGVINVMEAWLNENPYDFSTRNSEIYSSFKEFLSLESTKLSEHIITLKKMGTLVEKRSTFAFPSFSDLKEMSVLSSENTSLSNFSSSDIAEQLALLESSIFANIQPTEYLGQRWVNEDKTIGSGIKKYIEWFNRVSNLVSTQILTHVSAEERVKVLSLCIDVAIESVSIHNYNAAIEILSSCANSSISRLKKTWALLSEESKQKYENLRKIFSSEKNFQYYRQMMAEKSDGPKFPYLGVFLTDLTFIDDSNRTLINNGLINIEKTKLYSGVISNLTKWTYGKFNFKINTKLQDFLSEKAEVWDEANAYRISLMREPREGNSMDERVKEVTDLKSSRMDINSTEVSDHDWEIITAGGVTISFEKGEIILESSSRNDKIFRIVKGECINTVKVGEEQRELSVMIKGDIFGELSMVGQNSEKQSVVAGTNGELLVVSTEYLEKLFETENSLGRRFYQLVATSVALKLSSLFGKKNKNSENSPNTGENSGSSSSSQPNTPERVNRRSTIGVKPNEELDKMQKAANEKFLKAFKLGDDEKLLRDFKGASYRINNSRNNIGDLFISNLHLCFVYKLFGMKKQDVVAYKQISDMKILTDLKDKYGKTGLKIFLDTKVEKGGERLLCLKGIEKPEVNFEFIKSLWKHQQNNDFKEFENKAKLNMIKKNSHIIHQKAIRESTMTNLLENNKGRTNSSPSLMSKNENSSETENITVTKNKLYQVSLSRVGSNSNLIANNTNIEKSGDEMNNSGSNLFGDLDKISSGLTEKDWEEILKGSKKIPKKKGEFVIKEGQSYQRIYYILQGSCSVEICSKSLKLALIGKGETFGEVSLLLGDIASASVIADSEVTELQVIEGYFLRILFSYSPKLAAKFYRFLLELLANRLEQRERDAKFDFGEVIQIKKIKSSFSFQERLKSLQKEKEN